MSTFAKVKLTATAADSAAEVFVINSDLELVDRGIGTVTTEQLPGVYKIKVRAGQATREELVVLKKKSVLKEVGHLQIPSAVPLEQTGQSHEYHQAAVIKESATTGIKLGTGASIFVFARDWNPNEQSRVSGHHPAKGLSLRSTDGTVLVDLEMQSRNDLTHDPWAACNIDVKPGTYLLAVQVTTGEIFEMTLFALPGWRLQVFLLQRGNEKSPRGRFPDLASASIRMTKSATFSLAKFDDRLSEFARLALVDRRQVLTKELNQILEGKFQNPMLGILGGHLILRCPNPDLNLLKVVVENLRNNIFPRHAHPDVEALALAQGDKPRCDFAMPPMLRAGWEIVLEHSLRTPKLIPAGSLGARMAACITDQDPWLVWRDASTNDSWLDDLLPDFRKYLKTTNWHKASSRSASPAKRHTTAVKRGTVKIVDVGKRGAVSVRPMSSRYAIDTRLADLAGSLGLPPATVAELMAKVNRRLPS